MLEKIAASEDVRSAMEILDTLRSLRQTHSNLRMIYTGSVGLHHLLTELRASGYTNAPTNDMRPVEVGELDRVDGMGLASSLLLGENLSCKDPEHIADAISEAVDHVPFYIHLIVSKMRDRGNVASVDLVESIVQKALLDPHDRWQLQHYRERLNRWYEADQLPIVLALLDELAAAESSLDFASLAKAVRGAVPLDRVDSNFARAVLGGDEERLRTLIELLQKDHYLHRDATSRQYTFRFSFIKRWWMTNRSIR